jgi:N-acetylglucosamine-6-phosphate deacetylase
MSKTTITGRDPRSERPIRVTAKDGLISVVEETMVDSDLYLAAGFVDLQVNGYAGFDLNSEQISIDTVVGLIEAMLASGVTCLAPTLISAPEERICRALNVIAEARKRHRNVGACIPFVHVEGPHISPLDGFRGAHPAEAVRPPSIAEFHRWQSASGGIVGMVTLSPHYPESRNYIAALAAQGVHVAIGHTHATPQQISHAVEAGASLSTHLGNGIVQEIPRHTNPIWSQLAEDRLTATFIADGHHLPPDVLKVMLRAKGIGNSVLVSDSVALAGMAPGIYSSTIGGQVELKADGKLCILGSDFLAGSTASLAECISRAVRTTGVTLSDALAMATANPGRFAGGRGQCAPGSRADLVQFRWRDGLLIENVWLAGDHVYERPD